MVGYRYSFKTEDENCAKALGRDLPMSHKVSIEISNKLRGMDLQKAKILLERVIKKKQAIEMKRFMNGPGHKPGMSSGKYPIKASGIILSLLKSAEANAQFKGLNTGNLEIIHISAQKGSDAWHYGRKRRRKMKSTTLELVIKEKPKSEQKAGKVKEVKKESKPEAKAEVKDSSDKTSSKKTGSS